MTFTYRSLLISTVLVFATSLTACSFSESSGSVSESSESFAKSSNSSSDSSSDGSSDSSETSTRYQNEVTDYTVAYVKSGSTDKSTFQIGLSKVASQQSIINWEQNQDTYIGIGRGLKKANLVTASYEVLKKDFANTSQQKMQHIQKGFDLE